MTRKKNTTKNTLYTPITFYTIYTLYTLYTSGLTLRYTLPYLRLDLRLVVAERELAI